MWCGADHRPGFSCRRRIEAGTAAAVLADTGGPSGHASTLPRFPQVADGLDRAVQGWEGLASTPAVGPHLAFRAWARWGGYGCLMTTRRDCMCIGNMSGGECASAEGLPNLACAPSPPRAAFAAPGPGPHMNWRSGTAWGPLGQLGQGEPGRRPTARCPPPFGARGGHAASLPWAHAPPLAWPGPRRQTIGTLEEPSHAPGLARPAAGAPAGARAASCSGTANII